ncbi:MAG TPA: hydantoinase B/oxoprolinase family protein [Chloroflexota bacterium]|nr:hydantoinase B/oxoprolinase family protein [Chloroflexota bacterium]
MASFVEPAALTVDPVSFEVIRHRLLAITAEQAATLAAISGSKHVTEISDYNVGLYLADGAVATMGRTILYHASAMAAIVRHVIADCAENPGIGPDDMFVVNNPWKGAVHAQDMAIVAPIFHEGQLLAWSGAMMHMLDIGGLRPGSFCYDATECYQEGLNLPPVKLVEGGKLRQDILNIILSHSRMAPTVNLDLKGLIASNYAAARGFRALADRYGVQTVLAVMARLIQLSDERLRRRIRELPDATIEAVGYIDTDGTLDQLYEVVLELTKRGDRLIFDYSRSAPQAPIAINCTRAGLMAAIAAALMPTLAYDIPWNEGIFQPIEVVCPEGRICTAQKPAPASGGTLEAAWEVEMTATQALSKLVACSDQYLCEAQASPHGGPDGLTFSGINNHGERFTQGTLDVLASGGGAYCHRDGVWTQGHRNIERLNISNAEALEFDLPILYLWRGLARDGGGAGRHRGGLSLGCLYALHKTEGLDARCSCHGWEVPNALGIFGGLPGAENDRLWLRESNVRELLAAGRIPTLAELTGEVVPTRGRQGLIHLGPRDVIYKTHQAGGGWGDPLDRRPEDVQADLEFGAVSPEMAQALYGVVLDAAGRVDPVATAAHRAERRAARRRWPTRRKLTAAPASGALERVLPMGDQLTIVRDRAGAYWTRCACGHVLAPAQENWREYAGCKLATPAELGLCPRLSKEIEVRMYACPGCGRQHTVDVRRKGMPDLHDIRLVLEDEHQPARA